MKKQHHKTGLKIGYVSPGWPLSDFPNGIVAYIENMVNGLDENTQTFILARALKDFKPNENIVNLARYNLPKNVLQKLLDSALHKIKLPYARSILYQRDSNYLAQNLNSAIQKLSESIDIIEMEESFGFAASFVKVSKVPVVARLHGPNFIIGPYAQQQEDINFKLRVLHEGRAIINAHGVTSPSLDVLEKVRAYYNIALPNAKVIPNPVLPVNKQQQWQHGLNKIPSILYVGRFEPVKGGDLMLDAFRLIALQNKQVQLLFVGPDKGVNIDGKSFMFQQYLDRFMPEIDIKKRIQFLGHCNSQTIAKLRMNSLITVFPSRYENFPVSLLEALATGCPVVATAVGGIKEIIVNEYNGLLAEATPESIADKALALMGDPAKMQLLSKNAIKDCTERFSPKVVAAQTTDFYKSVLAKS
jgi:glycosyltransferase involved in cell wall biosynthesis